MNIGFGVYGGYRFFGATRGTIRFDPAEILQKAKEEKIRAKQDAKRKQQIKSVIGWAMSPVKKITETVATKVLIPKQQKKISEEQKIRAIIEKVLIEHGLINPNPHWVRIF